MHFGCCRGRCWCSGGATLSPRWQHRLLPLQQTQNLYRDQDRAWGSLSNPCLARGKKNGGLRWIFYLGAHSCSYELSFAAVRTRAQFQTFLICHLRQTTHPPAWLRWHARNNGAKRNPLKGLGGDAYLGGRCQGCMWTISISYLHTANMILADRILHNFELVFVLLNIYQPRI